MFRVLEKEGILPPVDKLRTDLQEGLFNGLILQVEYI